MILWLWVIAAFAAAQPNPKDAAAAAREARSHEKQGRPDLAVVQYQKAIQLDPSHEQYYTDFAHLLLRTQNFNEALVVLQAARHRFPSSAQAALSQGVALYGLRRFSEAVGAFIDAAKLDPDAEQPIGFLGRILEHAGQRSEELTALFHTYTQRHPQHWLGYFLAGKMSGDEKLLERSIALNGDFWESHFELGSVREKARNYAAAIESFRSAAALAPKNPQPHYRLFRLYARTGQTQKADLERALHEKLTEQEKAELDRRQAAAKHMELKVK